MSKQILASITPAHSTTTAVMAQVWLALLPGIAVMVWLFGLAVLVQIMLAIVSALCSEALVLWLRKRAIAASLLDGSALVSATLLALCIPPIAPWWLVVVGSFFMIVFGKQLYGGLGHNLFNPAMVGFVVLMISFPQQMTLWNSIGFYHELSLAQQLGIVFGDAASFDGITGATPLAGLNTAINQGLAASAHLAGQPEGMLAIQGWEMINLAFLAGGLFLLARGIISWYIPAAMLGSFTVIALLFHWLAPAQHPPLGFHLFSGATMLGAFFIATDPVTASTTRIGKLVYGIGIGFWLYMIRSFGSYHDAIAFSVLLMNMAVPLIDAYTKPKPFGRTQEHTHD